MACSVSSISREFGQLVVDFLYRYIYMMVDLGHVLLVYMIVYPGGVLLVILVTPILVIPTEKLCDRTRSQAEDGRVFLYLYLHPAADP